MKIHHQEMTPVIGAAQKLQTGIAGDGPVMLLEDEAKGQTVRVALSPDEARDVGIGLITMAGLWEMQEAQRAQQRSPPLVMQDYRNGAKK